MSKQVSKTQTGRADLNETLDAMIERGERLLNKSEQSERTPAEMNADANMTRQILKAAELKIKLIQFGIQQRGRVEVVASESPKALSGAKRIKELETELAALKKAG